MDLEESFWFMYSMTVADMNTIHHVVSGLLVRMNAYKTSLHKYAGRVSEKAHWPQLKFSASQILRDSCLERNVRGRLSCPCINCGYGGHRRSAGDMFRHVL